MAFGDKHTSVRIVRPVALPAPAIPGAHIGSITSPAKDGSVPNQDAAVAKPRITVARRRGSFGGPDESDVAPRPAAVAPPLGATLPAYANLPSRRPPARAGGTPLAATMPNEGAAPAAHAPVAKSARWEAIHAVCPHIPATEPPPSGGSFVATMEWLGAEWADDDEMKALATGIWLGDFDHAEHEQFVLGAARRMS